MVNIELYQYLLKKLVFSPCYSFFEDDLHLIFCLI